MRVKKSLVLTTITACIALNFSEEAKAGNISNYEDYRLYCSPTAFRYQVQSSDCHLHKNIYENRLQQELEQQPIRRRRTRRKDKNSNLASQKKFYVGASLGAAFPTEDVELIRDGVSNNDIENFIDSVDFDASAEQVRDFFTIDLDTGLAGSLFFGRKFNRNFGLDLEIAGFGGNVDTEDIENLDVTYVQGGLFLNPRFELPLSKNSNSLAIFLSPGIGITQGKVSLEIPDEVAEGVGINNDQKISLEDEISFAWQAKAGLLFPFSEKYSGFTQVRYMNSAGDIAVDLVSVEAGATIKF